MPIAMMLVSRDTKTGKSFDELQSAWVGIDPALMNDPKEKDRLDDWLRRTARLSDAVAYAWMMEAWTLDVRGMDILPQSVRDQPDRDEALVMMYQHRALGDKTHHTSRLIRRWRGKVKLGPWTETNTTYEGRFTDMLTTAAEEAVTATMIERLAHLTKTWGWTAEEVRERVDKVAAHLTEQRGQGPELAAEAARWFTGRLREQGCQVASRPADFLTGGATANDGGPELNWVNLNDYRPLPK